VRTGKPVDVDHAVIRGSINLRYSVIAAEFSVERSKFLNEVDFSYATAQRAFSGLEIHSIGSPGREITFSARIHSP
jgi:hypothetical protein